MGSHNKKLGMPWPREPALTDSLNHTTPVLKEVTKKYNLLTQNNVREAHI